MGTYAPPGIQRNVSLKVPKYSIPKIIQTIFRFFLKMIAVSDFPYVTNRKTSSSFKFLPESENNNITCLQNLTVS